MDRPSPADVRRVAVIGAGLVGSSWTAYFLSQGIEVAAADPAPGAKQRLAAFIRQAWPTLRQLGMAPDADPDRWSLVPDLESAAPGAEFVQENVTDDEGLKRDVFARLDAALPPEVVIASSSSALLMTPIQKGLRNPERCILAHPINPPHVVPLVEVSGGEQTDPAVLDWAMTFYGAIGKQPIRLNHEIVGHIANRMASALWQEAVSLVDRGVAGVEAIDMAITHGPGLRFSAFGPHMTYHLGGGRGGMARYLEHLGASQERRWRSLGRAKLTPKLRRKLIEGVKSEAGGRSVAELERERDACLVAILKALRQAHGGRGQGPRGPGSGPFRRRI